jgi:hypothetical protein
MVQSSETSLASIGRSLQKIAGLMETLNENFVKFAEMNQRDVVELRDPTAEEAYNKRLAERVEGYAAGMSPNYYREQQGLKKEGE